MKDDKKSLVAGLLILAVLVFGGLYFSDSESFLGYMRKKDGDSSSSSVKVPWWCVKRGSSTEELPPTNGSTPSGVPGGEDIPAQPPQSGGSSGANTPRGGSSGEDTGSSGGGSSSEKDNSSRAGSGTSSGGESTSGDGTSTSGGSSRGGFGGEWGSFEGESLNLEDFTPIVRVNPYEYYYENSGDSETIAKEKDDSGSADEGVSPGGIPDPFGGKPPVIEIVHECSCDAASYTLPQIPDQEFTCWSGDGAGAAFSKNVKVNGLTYKVTTVPFNASTCPKDLKQNEVYIINTLCGCGKDVYFDQVLQKEFACPKKYSEYAVYEEKNYKVTLSKIAPGFCPGNQWVCPEDYGINKAVVGTKCEAAKATKCAGFELDAEVEGVCNAFFPDIMLEFPCS